MGVKLRKRTLKDKYRLFLDVYDGGERKAEFLSLYLYKRPKDNLEKEHNKEVTKTAENIRAKRELLLSANDYDVQTGIDKRANFLEFARRYLEGYTKKDVRMITYSVRYLKEFAGSDLLPVKRITEPFCLEFRDWLYQHPNLNGETPYDFFAKFKKLLKQATREKLFAGNPASEVQNKMPLQSVQKDILSVEEIQQLAGTPCGNEQVRRAFLLACNTGLRLCDIQALKWKHIQGEALKMVQQKTGKPVAVNLNKSSLRLLAEPGKPEEAVFTLPSHTAVSKDLRHWTKRAGLTKHVTFHCARHSFATNLILHKVDVVTASSLLGHTSLDHTQKYVRVVESLKRQAVNKLPEIEL